MAPKTTKATTKSAPKKAAATKTTRKTTARRAAPVAEPVMPQMHACGCGHECACHAGCKCHKRGCSFWGVLKKIIIFIVIFALGFAAAKFCPCNKFHHHRGPRAEFVNGCLDASSIKCPKLLDALPAMDINADGCITRDEFRLAKSEMRREIREMDIQQVEIND